MSKIKICGLSREKDIEIVNQVLPDYIGFVFAKSSRQVSSETAFNLKKNLNPTIKSVGVFVNDSVEHIAGLCNSNIIDLIQLHGNEGESYIKELKRLVSNPIIKAVRVKGLEDLKKSNKNSKEYSLELSFDYSCDYLLFDTYQDNQYGGSGKAFDWSILSGIGKPYFLAGGINSGNILRAQEMCHPYCMDVSSGVETDGFKDADKIEEIVKLIRET